MTTWTRADRDRLCGGCGHQLAKGDVVLVVTLTGIRGTRVRCIQCAGPAPAYIPQRVAHPRITEIVNAGFSKVGAGLLPLDFARRAGEREPGEDDQ
jgi:hypothetical protein